jgi:hypothetical protein
VQGNDPFLDDEIAGSPVTTAARGSEGCRGGDVVEGRPGKRRNVPAGSPGGGTGKRNRPPALAPTGDVIDRASG